MRALIVVLLSLSCGSDGRRISREQQIRRVSGKQQTRQSLLEDQENMTEITQLKSQSDVDIETPSLLKILGVLGMAHMAQGFGMGAVHNPGAAMTGIRFGVGQANALTSPSLVNNRGRARPAALMNHDPGHTNGSNGSFFGLFAETDNADNYKIDAPDLKRLQPDQIQQRSPLSDSSHHRDIYKLASGELLFLMKGDATPFLLEQEFEALQAIEKVGINVASHRSVEVEHPVTGKIVRGLIEGQVSGEFVNIANDPEAAMKLVAQVSSDPLATLILKHDIQLILNSFNSGFQITDLQGFVQPDGHFVVINPGPYGVGNIFAGEYIGQSKMVHESGHGMTVPKLHNKLATTMMRLMEAQQVLEGPYKGRVVLKAG